MSPPIRFYHCRSYCAHRLFVTLVNIAKIKYVHIHGCKRTKNNIILVIRSVSVVLRAQSRFVKFVGGEAAGRTPYTFYKPTLGPKYVSNIPYNEFITPTTFI